MNTEDGKVCNKCREWKPFIKFQSSNYGPDKRTARCRKCMYDNTNKRGGFQHDIESEVEEVKRILTIMGYDVSQPIQPQVMEKVYKKYFN